MSDEKFCKLKYFIRIDILHLDQRIENLQASVNLLNTFSNNPNRVRGRDHSGNAFSS